MKSLHIILFVFIVLALNLSCEKEEVERPFARVRTLPVTEIDSTGATFHAEILSFHKDDITEYGFMWYNGILNRVWDTPDRFSHIALGTAPTEKRFSARIATGFVPGETYQVRAYLRSTDWVIYGEPVVFTASAEPAPVIEKILPENIVPGDTLQIMGEFFSNVKNGGKVIIGVTEVEIVASSATEIRCIAPFEITNNSQVTVQTAFGKKSVPFPLPTIGAPRLDRLIPSDPTIGDTITIEGSNFALRKEWNYITLSTYYSAFTVIEATRNYIKFIVPYMPVGGTTIDVSVRSSYDLSSNNLSFNLATPVIEDFFPKTVSYGDTLTILGKNFPPSGFNNNVYFSGVNLRILESNKQLIKVYIPEITFGNNMDISDPLQLVTLGFYVYSQAPLTYTNKDWKLVNDLPVSFPYDPFGFVLQNKIYFNNNNARDWWTYDLVSGNWQIIAQTQVGRPGEVFNKQALPVGEEVFIIQHDIYSQDSIQFIKFRPENGQISKIPSLKIPAGTSQNATSAAFTIHNQLYYCFSSKTNACWRFDATVNRWGRFNDFVDIFTGSNDGIKVYAGLTINQKAYLLVSNNFENLVLEYDPSVDRWEKIGPYPHEFFPNNQTSFVYKNKGYFLNLRQGYNQALEHDANQQRIRSWVMATPPDNNYYYEGQSFALSDRVYFAIGGKLYEWFPR